MKKLFKSKKFLGVLTAVLILALAGGTYSWFVISSDASTADINMGTLAMDSSFTIPIVDGTVFEPGNVVSVEADIVNTGNLTLMAKLDVNATTTLYRDEDGKPLGGTRTIENDPNVVYAIEESQLGWGLDEDGNVYMWHYNAQAPDEYYLYLEQGASYSMDFVVQLDGPGMTNEYMGASITFDSQWTATQDEVGAVEDVFGVDYEDIIAFQNYTGASASLSDSLTDPPITFEEAYERLFGVAYVG